MNSIRVRLFCRWLLACVVCCGVDVLAQPEPSGWFTGDIHVHRSCGGAPVSITSIRNAMASQDLDIVSLLADMGNGEVQNAAQDLPRVNGQNDPASTGGRILHWDAEWHWDATYTQFAHQALGGHIVALGLTNAQQIWKEYTHPIFQWIRAQGGVGGFAHMQYLDNGIPQTLNCCIPIEYPVEVALGSCDFISEDVSGSDTAMQAYYRLLNCGFRPGFAAGSDYPCNAQIGQLLTYAQVSGPLTYRKFVEAIRDGRTVVSRNGHREFIDLKVNGNNGPGSEIALSGSGSVTVNVQWTAVQNISGTLEIVHNGVVVASRTATVTATSPQTLSTTVSIPKSGWIAARRMGGGEHQLHTAAVFVKVNNAPIRASATDAQFYVNWMDTLLQRTSPGGIWGGFFSTNRAQAQARYQAAKTAYQQIALEASAPQPLAITTTTLPGGLINTPYLATLTASGGSTPYRWSVTNGALPAGLTLNTNTGTISGTPTATGAFNFTARVRDSSSPIQAVTRPFSINITPMPATLTLWPPSTVPSVIDAGPDNSVELGVKFRSDVAGNILGIRFYKATANTGTHVGSLWTGTGTLLASAAFTGETASGWQQALFVAPVPIAANTIYVASYHANTGHYSENVNYFASGVDNPPLHAPSSGTSGGNGVYRYGSSIAFPNQTWMSANYWVDVVFEPSGPPPPDTTPPAVTSVTPTAGSSGVSTNTPITVVFNEAMNASTINANTILLRNSANALVPAAVTYNGSSRTATLTPQSSLAPQATYTATVTGGTAGTTDAAGNPLAGDFVWSFTTGGVLPDTTPPTVTSVAPANGATGVSQATTVRATFSEAMQGSSINNTTFVLRNASGTILPATIAYDSTTRTATLTPASALTSANTHTATISGGAAGVADAAGNRLASNFSWSFTTGAQAPAYGLWDNSAVPAILADSDTAGVELGMKFRSSVPGTILGVRFYKSPANTGTHVGNLWTSTGTRLATVNFVNETASGWQYQAFPTPVPINPNTVYVVSYRAPVGRYSADIGYFATGRNQLALRALADGENGGNGVYRYGSTSAFPNQTWMSANYWVDVVFQPQ